MRPVARPRFRSQPGREIVMKFRVISSLAAVVFLLVALASAADSPDKKRDNSRKMAAQTLKELYKLQPTSEAAIKVSTGYAVFNNMGTNLFLLSTAEARESPSIPRLSRKRL